MKEELQIMAWNIDTYMKYYGYNQTSLAHKMGVSPQVVSKWCRGASSPSWENIDKMCDIFFCTRGQLLEKKQTVETIKESKMEKLLLSYYDKLNNDGKAKLLEFLEDMNPKFFKEES